MWAEGVFVLRLKSSHGALSARAGCRWRRQPACPTGVEVGGGCSVREIVTMRGEVWGKA